MVVAALPMSFLQTASTFSDVRGGEERNNLGKLLAGLIMQLGVHCRLRLRCRRDVFTCRISL